MAIPPAQGFLSMVEPSNRLLLRLPTMYANERKPHEQHVISLGRKTFKCSLERLPHREAKRLEKRGAVCYLLLVEVTCKRPLVISENCSEAGLHSCPTFGSRCPHQLRS